MTELDLSQPMPSIIVFGRDDAGKPHASWFDQANAELAVKAAGLMKMRAVPVETDDLRELVAGLPRGRVFSSGRAFTPFVKGKLYERLLEITRDVLGLAVNASTPEGGEDAPAPGNQGSGSDAASAPEAPSGGRGSQSVPPKRPTSAEQIGVGSLVLATTGPEEGWYEAEVIGLNGTSLTLKWRDYPAERTFVRRRAELGLLPLVA